MSIKFLLSALNFFFIFDKGLVRNGFIIFLSVFFYFGVYSQEKDSIFKARKIDSITILTKIDSLEIRLDSVKIKLDSLLKPFYKIQFDSIENKTSYTLKFRKHINSITNDTMYISIPKEEHYFTAKSNLVIDTLRILNFIKPIVIDTIKHAKKPVWWTNVNNFGIDISETTFINWNSGGNNSVSGLVKLNFVRSYKKLQLLWRNEIFARYGLNKQEDRELRKTDDKLEINSTFGYRKDTISNWYYSAKLNFKTQFTDGFNYPDTKTPISRFFAPAYLFLGIGTQLDLKNERFSIYLSPITLKSTFVFDEKLSNNNAFGVAIGKRSNHELGALVESHWKKEVVKNVFMNNKISLYTDYLKNLGNIDISWELNFDLKINKYLRANIGGHLIYDDDIKFKKDLNNDGILETLGARVQLKQLLGIGVLYNF